MQHPITTYMKNACLGLFGAMLSGSAYCDEAAIAKMVTSELATCAAYFNQQASKMESASVSEQTKMQAILYNKMLASKIFEQAAVVGGKVASEAAVGAALKEMKRREAGVFGVRQLADQYSQVCAAMASNPQYWTNITRRGTGFVCESDTKVPIYEQRLSITVRLPNESVLDDAEFSLASINRTKNEPEYLSDPLKTAMGTFSARTGNDPPRVQLFVILTLSTKPSTREKYTAAHGLLIAKESNTASTLTIQHEKSGFRFDLYDPAFDRGIHLSGPCKATSATAAQ
jgi:hypothetical protein